MVEIINVPTKCTRAMGWIQDSGEIGSLCDVVAVFDSESNFHNQIKRTIIPSLVLDKDGKQEMIKALNGKPLALKYKLLVGTSFKPRSDSRCNGIIQAAVKGQKHPFILDWPADNFVRWARAVGFIKYNYLDDTFSITSRGLELTRTKDTKEKENLLIKAILSYPPAYRVLSLLENPDEPLTKYEISEKLGFKGEEGFSCYPVRSLIAALAETEDNGERKEILANWESSSDKYARTIVQWLIHLGLVKNCKKKVSAEYGQKLYSYVLPAYQIIPKGERVLRNINGNSKHSKSEKIVSYEIFALKGKDREYLRLRRSYILKILIDNRNKTTYSTIQNLLSSYNFHESVDTIKDDIRGLINLGLNFDIIKDTVVLRDSILDFSIPVYKDPTQKSEISKEKDEMRRQLKALSHDYLDLMDLAFDKEQNRLFEIKVMDLFLNECGFLGCHLGGASRPDGVLYTDQNSKDNYGIIVDAKAYSHGFDLSSGEQDKMCRYIENNIKRNEVINSTKWWEEFPDFLKKFYFMFVSGIFNGNIADKLNKIYLEKNTRGTALPIVSALLVADKIKSKEMTLQDFENGINNTEYKILPDGEDAEQDQLEFGNLFYLKSE